MQRLECPGNPVATTNLWTSSPDHHPRILGIVTAAIPSHGITVHVQYDLSHDDDDDPSFDIVSSAIVRGRGRRKASNDDDGAALW